MIIDEYVDDLVKEVYGEHSKDLEELKVEIKSHLMEKVRELQEQGRSLESSVKLAIERFGDRDTLVSEIEGLYPRSSHMAQPNRKKTKITLLVKGVAILHFLWAIYILIVLLFWNIVLPKIIDPYPITIGERIALLFYFPQFLLHMLTSVGLWRKSRLGLQLTLFTYLSMLFPQIRSLIEISGWSEVQLQLFLNEGQYIHIILYSVFSIVGLYFIWNKRIREYFDPNGFRWRKVLIILVISILYMVINQLIYKIIAVG